MEEVINQVTKHTKLIALNASIEAMCAREAGLGFSVVVEEIRKLAEHTAGASSEISRMVISVQKETVQATFSVEQD